jgi:hypothetical protein
MKQTTPGSTALAFDTDGTRGKMRSAAGRGTLTFGRTTGLGYDTMVNLGPVPTQVGIEFDYNWPRWTC